MLHHYLDNVCDEIWQRLESSKILGISQGEETLTDNLLLYLASQGLSNLKIIPTPKYLEATKGTDWEWWIGNNRNGWLRYAIQAKKLDDASGRYTTLNHLVGKKPKQKRQHDILQKYAASNSAIPLYAFYNHIDLTDYKPYWNCKLSLDKPKFGCTVTPLKNVTQAINTRGSRTFEKIHKFKESIPIRCLAICPDILSIYTGSGTSSLSKFGVDAKVYKVTPFEDQDIYQVESYEQLPSQMYNHELGIYPKRILIIENES